MKYIGILFFLLTSVVANSQSNDPKINPLDNGKLKGKVIDAETLEPVEFATISIQSYDKPYTNNGCVSNENGVFILEKIKEGFYKITVKYIGYTQYTIDSVSILKNQESKIKIIKLFSSQKKIKEVTIEGQQGAFRNNIDKKTFDVDKNISSAGQSTLDVLKNVPSVSVDIDGNVSLRGSENVTILIDGKPSSLTGSSRKAILEQIPASSIQSIEIITNPSAKYDPDGMAGILNVILKKNTMQGLNGLISVSAGSGNKYNGSSTLNYRNRKINLFANYTYKNNQRRNSGHTYRENFFTDTIFYYNQTNQSKKNDIGHTGKVGADYTINEMSYIGVSSTFNISNNTNKDSILYTNKDENDYTSRIYNRITNKTENESSIDISLNYQKKFKHEGKLLTLEANRSSSLSNNSDEIVQNDLDFYYLIIPINPANQNTVSNTKFSINTAKLDFSYPRNEKSRFETGLKATIRNNDKDFLSEDYSYQTNEWINNLGLSNHFIYNEQVYAAYATYSNGYKNFTYQLGTRAEKVYIIANLANTAEKHLSNYLSFYPSIHLNQKLKNDQELQLSYSRRVNRPGFRELNPFPEYNDPLNLRVGNPYLKPEYIDSYELSDIKYFKKLSISSSIYYKKINNVIQRIKEIQPSGVAITSNINLNSAISYGVEMIAKTDLFKWWNLTTSINFYQSIINGTNVDAALNNDGISWFAKMMSNFTVWKNMQIQVSGNYQAALPLPQGTMKPNYSVDIGLKKDILKNKASISIACSDIFNTQQMNMILSDANFYQDMTRKKESRILTFTFLYRFGQSDISQKRKGGKTGEGQNEIRGGEESY